MGENEPPPRFRVMNKLKNKQMNLWVQDSSRFVSDMSTPPVLSVEFCNAVWDSLRVANGQQTQSQLMCAKFLFIFSDKSVLKIIFLSRVLE